MVRIENDRQGVVTVEDAHAFLSELTLDEHTLSEVYIKACGRWGRRVNSSVLSVFPPSLGAYEVVVELDFKGCYFGASGVGPLMPVILACERLRRLSLHSVGMRRDGAMVLCQAAMAHPSLAEIDLSGNELGTTAGSSVLELCERNTRIVKVGVSDCLLIAALQRRIARQCTTNAAQERLDPPLIPFRYIPTKRGEGDKEPTEAELAEERENAARREAERLRILDKLPYWMPAACEELSEALMLHTNHFRDLVVTFQPVSALPDACTPREFRRVMKVLGCRFLEAGESQAVVEKVEEGGLRTDPSKSEPREVTFARLLGCYRNEAVHFEELLGLLRTHAIITTAPDWPSPELPDVSQLRTFLDAVYDSRHALAEACEALAAGVDPPEIEREEMIAGLAGLQVRGVCGELSSDQRMQCAEKFLTAAGFPSSFDRVNSKDVLSRVASGERPAIQWRSVTVSALNELRERLGHQPPLKDPRLAPRRPRLGEKVILAPEPERTDWGKDPRHWGVLRGGGEGVVVGDDGSECVPLRVERNGAFDLYNCEDLRVLPASEPEEP
eukprot:Hpha_TRINITY_DN35101_c0_g1::TRINITY_DN35101_c0_g1_i1::g.168376::m.168376